MTKPVLSLVVCVCLALAYFVVRKDQTRVGVRELVLPQFQQTDIDTIEINGKEFPWNERAIDAAAHIQIIRFMTEQPQPAMIKVRLLHHRKVIWQLEIGDEVSEGRLVRAPGSKSIFVAKGKFSDLLMTN